VGDDFGDSFGYLSIIDGVPWLAATEEEAATRVPATMFQLDPQLLEALENAETGEKYLRYLAYLERTPL